MVYPTSRVGNPAWLDVINATSQKKKLGYQPVADKQSSRLIEAVFPILKIKTTSPR